VSALELAMNGGLRGSLSKMPVILTEPINYTLAIGDEALPLNGLLGHQLSIEYLGEINCSHCGRRTKTSFSQGFCYPCFRKLPQCDTCIVSPEKCHYSQGTCRDPAWGEQFCMTDHIVYLANSSGIKVGITRASQVPTRWIDQGATQALPFIRVATRYQSGIIETLFKEFVSDRTNWRTMLKGAANQINLKQAAAELLDTNQSRINSIQTEFGINAIQPLTNADEVLLHYPVNEYPVKVTSLSFDKTPIIEGVLMGIKGQYLIFDTGVLNIRKHSSYQVKVSVV